MPVLWRVFPAIPRPKLLCGWGLLALSVASFGLSAAGCDSGDGPSLSARRDQQRRLLPGQFFPATSEREASGPLLERVERGSESFKRLVRGDREAWVFKDEERTGADLVMSPRLREKLALLSEKVAEEWPGTKLRITEAWDEQLEHGTGSLHYAGRAADVTTSDVSNSKLSRLAGLAVTAGFDWVYYESTHVHVSVK
ncbi:MAG: hypothetical protein SFV15_15565 [Polyangiaceae bacterium]|nr:hypothetical protein [Polyangiaceae bacterium]